ncbi:hypothetical protein SHX68_005469, partial [Escherichia coli]|nr:hypothetical protein [Escherichia coli]HBC2972840.1 hypothetical protein [Escherichia coli O146]
MTEQKRPVLTLKRKT